MKIIELKAENIKRIKAVEIKPKDNVVLICGKNDQGKTSVLDSIWYALAGKDSLKNTPIPIRKGTNKAEATITLDDFIVTRKWTANDKTYLQVTNREGLSYKSPQQLIDSFVGKLSFDPLSFAQMKQDEQKELLLGLIDLGVNLDEIDTKINELYEERRFKGRDIKMLQGQREEIDVDNLPEKLISILELQNEYEKGLKHNQKIENAKESIMVSQNQLEILENQLKEIQRKIIQTKKFISETESYLENAKLIDINSIKQKINQAENINEKIRARERNKEADRKLQQAQNEYNEFTKKIEELIKQKTEALQKAKMPINGLGINDSGVTYNDIPFGQLSSSEQLKISISIAMAFNPKLRVIRITDGSLLDDDNMKIIYEMAKDKDYQIWIERVGEDGEGMSFIIEDGEIKS